MPRPSLHVHEWGDPAASEVICLHGVTGHGRRFRKLAEERLAQRYHVRALDLRGHGNSTWDEPWDLATHVADVVETVDERAAWIGHSFGARLIMEITARQPDLVERAVFLDPAIHVPPPFCEVFAGEEEQEKVYASVDQAIAARLPALVTGPRAMLEDEMSEHLVAGEDGLFRYRYSQAAVARAYRELAQPPPPFERLRVPTLLVVGVVSKIVSAGELEAYRAALGDMLRVVVTPGGHSPLWDAFEETADAIEEFLA